MNIIHLNGKLTDDTAIFNFQDRLRLGDGVFDTILVIDGKPQHHDAHIARLLDNAKMLHLNNTPDTATLKNAALQLIESNESLTGRFALNTLITRGVASRGLAPTIDTQPTIAMRLAPVPDKSPPIHTIIAQTVRRNEGSPLSQIKSCNYGDNILALTEAQQKDANEAILLNNKGLVTCASAGNIFAQIKGELITPPLSDGVLNGITRQLTIERHAAKIRSITAKELESADGIYITNSIKGVQPIATLNGKKLPEPSIKISQEGLL